MLYIGLGREFCGEEGGMVRQGAVDSRFGKGSVGWKGQGVWGQGVMVWRRVGTVRVFLGGGEVRCEIRWTGCVGVGG